MQENFILRDSVICVYSDRLLGNQLPLRSALALAIAINPKDKEANG